MSVANSYRTSEARLPVRERGIIQLDSQSPPIREISESRAPRRIRTLFVAAAPYLPLAVGETL